MSCERACRGCGCTDSDACPEGCSWVLLDLYQDAGICSACADRWQWNPVAMTTALNDGFPESYFPPAWCYEDLDVGQLLGGAP